MSVFRNKKSNTPRRRYVESVENKSTPSQNFKRNRTLSGTSNRLNGINDESVKSPRTQAHDLSTQRRKLTGILMIIFAIVITIWILLNNFTASVDISATNIDIVKNIDKSKYTNAVQDYLNINPVSRVSFFLNQSSLTSYVASKLPETENVNLVNSKGMGRTNFSITFRKPVAGWRINDKQYYVDSSGIPFGINYFSNPSVRIVDNSGISLKIGTKAIASNRFLSFIGRVVTLTEKGGYTVTQAALPVNTTRELELRLKEVNYPIKLSIDRPAGEQVEDMVMALNYFRHNSKTIRYLDVRVGGKAFFK